MIFVIKGRNVFGSVWRNLIAFYEYEQAINWKNDPINLSQWPELKIEEIPIY